MTEWEVVPIKLCLITLIHIYMVNLINLKSVNSKSLKPGFLLLKRLPKLKIKS